MDVAESKISPGWLITIPKGVRTALKLEEGKYIVWSIEAEENNQHVEIRKKA